MLGIEEVGTRLEAHEVRVNAREERRVRRRKEVRGEQLEEPLTPALLEMERCGRTGARGSAARMLLRLRLRLSPARTRTRTRRRGRRGGGSEALEEREERGGLRRTRGHERAPERLDRALHAAQRGREVL